MNPPCPSPQPKKAEPFSVDGSVQRALNCSDAMSKTPMISEGPEYELDLVTTYAKVKEDPMKDRVHLNP